MKQKLILIISVVVGLLAFILTNNYIKSVRDELYKDAEEIEVIAAAADLAQGTELKFEDIGVTKIFRRRGGYTKDYVEKKDKDMILGRKLKYSVEKRQPILWADVEMPEGIRSGLSPIIKTGMRAVSLAIAGEASVSSLVQPNDRVDIIGTFSIPSVTMTLLQDVSVLATGQRLAKQELENMGDRWSRVGNSSYSTVTFEVTPREAELLVFAQGVQGRLTLTLRNPDDVGFEKILPEVNFQHIEKSLPELNDHRQKVIRHKTNL
ncbi:MAG: Flp pilus assembly protein CpaB [Kiritimatiellaeota bacterium]|nr:Flp pilus assembly protein CpaB [Kiritimatiellota bacterium]